MTGAYPAPPLWPLFAAGFVFAALIAAAGALLGYALALFNRTPPPPPAPAVHDHPATGRHLHLIHGGRS